MDAGALERPFRTLSGGEQAKVRLAALFLRNDRFLLIDEPTNHLDARGRALVSAYLRRKKGFLLVSHDRRFLDGCVDHILALNRADVEVRAGSFSAWLADFQARQQGEEAQDRRLRQDIKRLRQSALRSADWSDRVEASKTGAADKGYVGHKSAKMMKRAKSIEARQQKAIGQKSQLLQNRERAEPLKMHPLPHFARTLVTCSELSLRRGGRTVCLPVSFRVDQGQRVLLEGKNGAGKTSLLRLLLGEPIDHTGTLATPSGLVISYVPQDASHLRGTLTRFARDQGVDAALLMATLRRLDFDRALFDADLAALSAGQKKKVLLAKSLCQEAHLFLWDEPLNFIDLYSRMQLEALLTEFSPTMIFVEHDRAFQEAVATQSVTLSSPASPPAFP